MKNAEENDSFLDRLIFAIIAAFFGLLLGGVVALLFFLISHFHASINTHFKWWILYFTGFFFFILGLMRGIHVADTVVEAIGIIMFLLLGWIAIEGGWGGGFDPELQQKPDIRWLAIYILGIAMITWLT